MISPVNSSVEVGSTVALTCVGYGNPIVSVTWSKEDIQLNNSSRITTYENMVTGSGIVLVQSILVICSVDEADSGQYSCVVGNTLGNSSVNFDLSVTPVGGKYYNGYLIVMVHCCVNLKFLPCIYFADRAQILIHPNQSTEVDAYNTVIVACVAYGNPSPSISWNKGDMELTNTSRATIYEVPIIRGEVIFIQSILELCWAEEADAGEYSCFSENSFGNDTATFILIVNARGKLTLLTIS